MTKKKIIKSTLIFALFALALGGWLLHYRIHPLEKSQVFYVPFIIGIVSAFIVPVLFCYKKTLDLAYILNGLFVILGTITMTQLSIKYFQGPLSLKNLIVGTLFADIMILWGKFAVGKAIFSLESLKSEADPVSKGRFYRYPNMGWWWVHLVAIAVVYYLGNLIWK
jgi:hypothetical protein